MADVWIYKVLTRPQFDALRADPIQLLEKVEKVYEELIKERDRILSEETIEKLNSEQSFNKLEQSFISTKTDLETLNVNFQKAKLESDHYRATVDQLNLDNQHLKQKVTDLENVQYQTSKAAEELHSEKRDTLGLVERKNQEVKKLTEEVKQLNEKGTALANEKLDLQKKVNEIESSKLQLQFENTRLAREKENFDQQCKWAMAELESKTHDLSEIRKEKTTQIAVLQRKLDEATQAKEVAEEALRSLQVRAKDIETQKATLADKLKEAKDELVVTQENSRQEVDTQSRLVELYKRHAEDYEIRMREYQQVADGQHTILAQERENYETKLQLASEQITKLVEDNASLSKEVQLLSARLASPISTTILSPTSRPLELQIKYEEASRQLIAEKNENRRMNTYLDQILKEIESKGPMLQEQRAEYERAIRRNEKLTNQLEAAMIELESLRANYTSVEKDRSITQREAEDLSRQVQLLLKENLDNRSSNQLQPEPNTIPDELITFDTIQQLQLNNRELLRIVHQLQDEKQRDSVAQYDVKLVAAEEELRKLRDQRSQAETLVAGIVRQRDMYRALCQNKDRDLNEMQGGPNSSGPQLLAPDYHQLLKELQEEFDKYRKERSENDRIINEKLIGSANLASETRVQLAKAQSQNELYVERLALLQSNIESHKRDNDTLRNRNLELQSSLIDHQRRIEDARQQVLDISEKLKRLEVTNNNLRVEKEVIQSSENRMLAERGSFIQERDRTQSHLDNLEALLLSKEANETEVRRRLISETEKAKEELNSLRKQDEELRNERTRERAELDLQVKQANLLTEAKDKQLQDTREQFIKAAADQENLTNQVKDFRAQLAKSEQHLELLLRTSRGTALPGTEETTPEKRLEFELCASRTELVNIKESLAVEQQHLAHYKEIASTNEVQLRELTTAYDAFKIHSDAQTIQLTGERDRLQKRVQELEGIAQTNVQEQEALEKQIRDYVLATETSKQQTESLENQLKATNQVHEELQKSISLKNQLVEEAQANYLRELLAHSKDVEILNANSKEIQEVKDQLNEMKSKYSAEASAKQSTEATFNEVRTNLEKQISSMDKRNADLDKQNATLHSQLDRLHEDLKRSQIQQAGITNPIGEPDQLQKQLSELREVLHFLRAEKTISDASTVAAKQEAVRLKQQLDHNLRALDETRVLLRQAEENLLSKTQTDQQHEATIQQIQQLNLLRESNVTLRDENEKATRRIRELQSKINELEAKFVPLQEEKAQLNALKEVLQAEKSALETENGRWRQRAQQLIDRYQRIDPEQHEKLQEDFKLLQERIAQLVSQLAVSEEQLEKEKQEATRLNQQITQLTLQVQNSDQERKKLQEEKIVAVEEKNKLTEEKTKLNEEKEKIAADLKSEKEKSSKSVGIAKNLKIQLEKRQKEAEETLASQKGRMEELEKLRTEFSELQGRTAQLEELEKRVKELQQNEELLKKQVEEKEKTSKDKSSRAASMLTDAKNRINELSQSVQQLKEEQARNLVIISKYERQLKRSTEESAAGTSSLSTPTTAPVAPTIETTATTPPILTDQSVADANTISEERVTVPTEVEPSSLAEANAGQKRKRLEETEENPTNIEMTSSAQEEAPATSALPTTTAPTEESAPSPPIQETILEALPTPAVPLTTAEERTHSEEEAHPEEPEPSETTLTPVTSDAGPKGKKISLRKPFTPTAQPKAPTRVLAVKPKASSAKRSAAATSTPPTPIANTAQTSLVSAVQPPTSNSGGRLVPRLTGVAKGLNKRTNDGAAGSNAPPPKRALVTPATSTTTPLSVPMSTPVVLLPPLTPIQTLALPTTTPVTATVTPVVEDVANTGDVPISLAPTSPVAEPVERDTEEPAEI